MSTASVHPKYQLFQELTPEEKAALEADIAQRGLLHPVEVDEHGTILDGHTRAEIADRLGIPCPKVVQRFGSEQEKLEHIFRVNAGRRQLTSHQWGLAFRRYLEALGVRRGSGARNDRQSSTCATVAEVARRLGVPLRTAHRRLAIADAYAALPGETQAEIACGKRTLKSVLPKQNRTKRQADRTAAPTAQPELEPAAAELQPGEPAVGVSEETRAAQQEKDRIRRFPEEALVNEVERLRRELREKHEELAERSHEIARLQQKNQQLKDELQQCEIKMREKTLRIEELEAALATSQRPVSWPGVVLHMPTG